MLKPVATGMLLMNQEDAVEVGDSDEVEVEGWLTLTIVNMIEGV